VVTSQGNRPTSHDHTAPSAIPPILSTSPLPPGRIPATVNHCGRGARVAEPLPRSTCSRTPSAVATVPRSPCSDGAHGRISLSPFPCRRRTSSAAALLPRNPCSAGAHRRISLSRGWTGLRRRRIRRPRGRTLRLVKPRAGVAPAPTATSAPVVST
jgi:hypothetical protein